HAIADPHDGAPARGDIGKVLSSPRLYGVTEPVDKQHYAALDEAMLPRLRQPTHADPDVLDPAPPGPLGLQQRAAEQQIHPSSACSVGVSSAPLMRFWNAARTCSAVTPLGSVIVRPLGDVKVVPESRAPAFGASAAWSFVPSPARAVESPWLGGAPPPICAAA